MARDEKGQREKTIFTSLFFLIKAVLSVVDCQAGTQCLERQKEADMQFRCQQALNQTQKLPFRIQSEMSAVSLSESGLSPK